MKRRGYRLCAWLATLLAAWLLYRYGLSPLTLALAPLLLACPLAALLSLVLARKTERDIALAIRAELTRRARSAPGSKP
ncbi:hypothetical protein [Pseudomonas sp. PL-6]